MRRRPTAILSGEKRQQACASIRTGWKSEKLTIGWSCRVDGSSLKVLCCQRLDVAVVAKDPWAALL